MKKLPALVLLCLVTTAYSVVAQEIPFVSVNFAGQGESEPAPSTNFVRFDLSFPGGPPARLIQMIQDTTKKPLNVIVPEEHAGLILPELTLKGVTVPQLFDALGQASHKVVFSRTTSPPYGAGAYGGGAPQFTPTSTSYGFKTKGQATPDSVWHFFVDAPVEPPVSPLPAPPEPAKVCRFYQLGPYLDELKVEDITTALETAWKMLGEKSTPDLKFHKDTKLLIAVGPADKLTLIDAVLTQLRAPQAFNPPYGFPGAFVPGNNPAGASPVPSRPRPAKSEPEKPQPPKP
jgi:hypothetical protein